MRNLVVTEVARVAAVADSTDYLTERSQSEFADGTEETLTMQHRPCGLRAIFLERRRDDLAERRHLTHDLPATRACRGPLSFTRSEPSMDVVTSAPSLAEFGLASMTQNGREASGARPLLVLLVEYSDFPPFSKWHPMSYYEQLAFGNPLPPFTTKDPVNPAGLVGYFLENSGGTFTFTRVDLIGPIQRGQLVDPGPRARTAEILAEAAAASPGLFVGLDSDGDFALEFNELCVLLFENIPEAMPANRDNNPVVIQVPVDGALVPLSVVVHWAGAGPLTPFYQVAHEVSHSLGTVDLYNVGQGNFGITLMSGYPFYSDDQGSVHLDAWHKLLLGWIEPNVRSLDAPGDALVFDGPGGFLLLWGEARREREYFLVEARLPRSGTRVYDDGVPSEGVCIWRVDQTMGYAGNLGTPDLAIGGSSLWSNADRTPTLPWSDGSSSGRTLESVPVDLGTWRVFWE
jgi:M6 family metalloprotease-like protein